MQWDRRRNLQGDKEIKCTSVNYCLKERTLRVKKQFLSSVGLCSTRLPWQNAVSPILFSPAAQATQKSDVSLRSPGLWAHFLHEHRAWWDTSHNGLFFGEQHAETDFYYRVPRWITDNARGRFHRQISLAFPRDQEKKLMFRIVHVNTAHTPGPGCRMARISMSSVTSAEWQRCRYRTQGGH